MPKSKNRRKSGRQKGTSVERNKPSPSTPHMSLEDFLVSEFRTHAAASRLIEQGRAETQGAVEHLSGELRDLEQRATKKLRPSTRQLIEEEIEARVNQLAKLRNDLATYTVQVRERAGMLWMVQRLLSKVDSDKWSAPQRLPGTPPINDAPSMDGINPLTIAERNERIRERELQELAQRKKRRKEAAQEDEQAQEPDLRVVEPPSDLPPENVSEDGQHFADGPLDTTPDASEDEYEDDQLDALIDASDEREQAVEQVEGQYDDDPFDAMVEADDDDMGEVE